MILMIRRPILELNRATHHRNSRLHFHLFIDLFIGLRWYLFVFLFSCNFPIIAKFLGGEKVCE